MCVLLMHNHTTISGVAHTAYGESWIHAHAQQLTLRIVDSAERAGYVLYRALVNPWNAVYADLFSGATWILTTDGC